MNSVFGLKEIRFVHSGDFIHEIVDITTSTLLLGSSGVGKTTIMSAACYFYTMDKDKSRPDNQDQTFYEWHLATPVSHIIYKYTNHTGDNLLILSKEEKPKHTFINIHNYNKDIKSLYLDQDGNALELKEILENCNLNNIPYYKTETFTLYKKLLHKHEYRTLKEKDKPPVDFSLFKDHDNSKIFSEHLFKIYKSSSIHDSTIKNMLISLIDTNENKFDIIDFRTKLDTSLQSVEQIELLKNKRDITLEIDRLIVAYKHLLVTQDNLGNKIYEVSNNKNQIDTFIQTKLYEHQEQFTKQKQKIDLVEDEKKEVLHKYIQEIAIITNKIEDLEERQIEFKDYKIDEKINEQNKENNYLLEKETLTARYNALDGDLKDIKTKEELQKADAKNSLINKRNNEKDSLEEKRNTLNQELVTLVENTAKEIEEKTNSLEEKHSQNLQTINDLNSELVGMKIQSEFLPKQEIKNDSIIYIKKIVQNLEDEIKSLKFERLDLEKEIESKKNSFIENEKMLHTKREEEVLQYNSKKDEIDNEIKQINSKLNYEKKNLYGFINRSNHPYKNEILTITKDDILFKDGIEFEQVEGNNLYGLNIYSDLSDITEQYDIGKLERQKNSLNSSRDSLVAQHNITMNKLDNKSRDTGKIHTKVLRELTRKQHQNESRYNQLDSNLKTKLTELDKEIEFEKTKVQNQIVSLKESIDTKQQELSILTETNENIKQNILEIKREIESNKKLNKEKIEKELRNIKQHLNTLENKYSTLIQERYEQIEKEFQKVLETKNIDPTELNSLNSQIKTIESKLNSIHQNNPRVDEYLRLKPEFDDLINKSENLQKLKLRQKEDEKSYTEQIKTLKIQQNKFQKSINHWSAEQEKFIHFISETKYLLSTSNIIGDIFGDNDIASYIEQDYFSKLLIEHEQIISDINHRIQEIKSKTESLTRGVPQNNILKLRTCNMDLVESDSVESYINIAQDYIVYIKEELDIQGASLQLRALSETIHAAVSQIKHIEEDVNIISSEVNKINNMLKVGISGIGVIDHIHLNYSSYTSDELLNQIKIIGELLDKEYSALFSNNEQAETSKDKIVKQAKNLKELLQKDFKQSFSISDMSKLSFDISENGKMHANLATLNTIGSNGTTIMVKTVIYLTLLKKVSNKFDSNLKLHCILDEIGQISADYFSELLNYASSLNFSFLNGTAANDDDMIYCYTNIYTGIRNGNKTDILKFIVEDIFEEDIV